MDKKEVWAKIKEADPDKKLGMKWTDTTQNMEDALAEHEGNLVDETPEEDEIEEDVPEEVVVNKPKKARSKTHRTVIPLINIAIDEKSSDPKDLKCLKHFPGHEEDGYLILRKYTHPKFELTKDVLVPNKVAEEWYRKNMVCYTMDEIRDFEMNPNAFRRGMRTVIRK